MAGLGNDVFGGDKAGADGGAPAAQGPKAPTQGGIAGKLNFFRFLSPSSLSFYNFFKLLKIETFSRLNISWTFYRLKYPKS